MPIAATMPACPACGGPTRVTVPRCGPYRLLPRIVCWACGHRPKGRAGSPLRALIGSLYALGCFLLRLAGRGDA